MLIHNAVLTGSLTLPSILPITGSLIMTGSIGIGTVSPTARLHISGTTGVLLDVDGVNGVNALFVSSSGNVGIGTTSPSTLFQTNQAGSTGYFYSGQQSGTEIAYWYYNASEVQFSSKSATRGLALMTNDTTRLFISASGNVGINTSSPNFLTHISTGTTTSITQPTAGTYGLYIQQNSSGNVGGLYIQDGASNSGNSIFVGDNNGAPRFVVNTDGNVGIGTSSPAALLHVLGANTTNRGQLSIQSNNGSNAARASWYFDTTLQGNIGTTSADFYVEAVNNLQFYAGGAERLRIGDANARNAAIDLKGNVISSFYNFGDTLAAGATYSTTITQVLYEYQTSYIVDAVGLYAPSGTNIAAYATSIVHLFADGSTSASYYSTITSTGLSITTSINNAGVANIVVTNTSGASMSNNNIRITKINRMN